VYGEARQGVLFGGITAACWIYVSCSLFLIRETLGIIESKRMAGVHLPPRCIGLMRENRCDINGDYFPSPKKSTTNALSIEDAELLKALEALAEIGIF
jgi:hypothetical protein